MKQVLFPLKISRFIFPILLMSMLTGESIFARWHHRWTVNEHDLGMSLTLGPYHSYTNLFYQIEKNQPVYVYRENEVRLYRDLLLRSCKPAYGLVEFTVYPTTALSAWIKSNYKDFYDQFTIYKDINLIGSINGGYQEPWSASLFTGQIAAFLTMNDDEDLVVAATGVSGPVVTGGAYQIFDNCLVRSNWYRVEWKLKGKSNQAKHSHEWDIKAGYRFYNLDEVANTLLFSFTRKRMTNGTYDWRWMQNSTNEFELQLPVSYGEKGISRFKIIYGKAIPFWKWMVGLGIGVIYENRRQYDRELKQFSTKKEENWNLFLMPFAYW